MSALVGTRRAPVVATSLILVTLATFALARPVHAANYNHWWNAYSQKCLDVPYGNYYYGQKVQQYTCNGGSNQLWSLLPWYDGSVSICAPVGNPQWCIGRQQTATNGAKAILVYYGGSDYGRWVARTGGTVIYTFTSLYDARCLDDPGWSKSSGVWIQVYNCTGGSNQGWTWF